MSSAIGRSFIALGWLFLLVFVTGGTASHLDFKQWPIGSTVGLLIIAGLSVLWLRLGWQTLKRWFSPTLATVGIMLALIPYAGVIYLVWREQNTKSTRREAAELDVSAEDMRLRVAQIDPSQAKDLDDYLARADEFRTLVPEMQRFLDSSSTRLQQLRAKYQSRPDLLRLADVIEAMNKKDFEGFQLLKEEMRLADELRKLPRSRRKAYFKSQIAPVQERELQIAEEEMEIAASAMNRGIPLPADIRDLLRARQDQLAKRSMNP